jgi:hypothetical protein
VLDGEVAIKISGQPFQLKTAEAIVMPRMNRMRRRR